MSGELIAHLKLSKKEWTTISELYDLLMVNNVEEDFYLMEKDLGLILTYIAENKKNSLKEEFSIELTIEE